MPPPPSSASTSRSVVLSLYRACLRWTQIPLVVKSKFIAGDHLPLTLAALQLSPRLLTNKEGIEEAIRMLFRANAKEMDAKVVSEKMNLAVDGLQYLNRFTRVLRDAESRREANRARDGLTFRVGQVVRHKLYNYRAAIVGWDRRPAIDVSRWEGVLASSLGVNQPFYHCIPDSNDTLHFLGGVRKLMYVAQENLELCHALESRINSDVIPQAFECFDPSTQSFLPTERITWQYPADHLVPRASPTSPSSTFKPRTSGFSRKFRASVQRAKAVDASQRVRAEFAQLADRIGQSLESRFGNLERFHAHEPAGILLSLLARLKEIDASFPPSVPSLSLPSTAPASPCSSLEQILPAYHTLAAFRDLLALCQDVSSARRFARDRDGVLYQVGQAVRHATLGYRGVVCGWERFPKRQLPSDQPDLSAGHPHYRVIVNDEDRRSSPPPPALVVLPQNTLAATPAEESAVISPLIPENFLYYDPVAARYRPNGTLEFKYSIGRSREGEKDYGGGDEEASMVEVVHRVLTQVLVQARSKGPRRAGMKADLFMLLQGAMRKEDADVAESTLWSLWLAHTDADVSAFMDDGIQFMLRGKYDLAISRFNAALALDPGFSEAYNKRSTANFLSGRYEEAKKDAVVTLNQEPSHWGALLGRGLIDYEIGQKLQAIKAFRATLRIHPWSTNVGTTLFHTRKQLETEEVMTMMEPL